MSAKPNLDQGNPMAKDINSPSPLAKQKRANLERTKTDAKAKNVPTPYGKNKEGQTYRKNPSSTAPTMSPDDDRIRRELVTPGHKHGHSRGGR